MLVSEIPSYFIEVTAGKWSDPSTQQMFFVDPMDATMLVSRVWTPTELTDYNSQNLTKEQNTEALRKLQADTLKSMVARKLAVQNIYDTTTSATTKTFASTLLDIINLLAATVKVQSGDVLDTTI